MTEEYKADYFAMIPNMVDELGLSVYAYRLYGHLKRVTGEVSLCWQSTDTLSEICGMSRGKVSQAKKELERAGLIRVKLEKRKGGGRDYHLTTVLNIWDKNHVYFDGKKAEATSSPHGLASSPHGLASSCGDTKEYPTEEKLTQENGLERCPEPFKAAEAKNASAPFASDTDIPPRQGDDSLQHEVMPVLKQLTGYYPRKAIRRKVIEVWDKSPEYDNSGRDRVTRLQAAFTWWTSKGYNPQNYDGWFFEHFRESLNYLPDLDRQKADFYARP